MNESENKKNKKNIEDKTYRYNKAKEYWENCDSTIYDMLGGNPEVNDIDIKVSKQLLEVLTKTKFFNFYDCLDCGAGIGRVTDNVLQHYFNNIDLVEMNPKFVEYAKNYFANNKRIKNIFSCSLQKFKFQKKYDCIWIQWCLENLEDDDLNRFLTKCSENLKDTGFIVIKENIEEDKDYSYFETDFSKIRSDKIFKHFFEKNKLFLYKHFHHPYWPLDLMKVSIFVLTKKNLI